VSCLSDTHGRAGRFCTVILLVFKRNAFLSNGISRTREHRQPAVCFVGLTKRRTSATAGRLYFSRRGLSSSQLSAGLIKTVDRTQTRATAGTRTANKIIISHTNKILRFQSEFDSRPRCRSRDRLNVGRRTGPDARVGQNTLQLVFRISGMAESASRGMDLYRVRIFSTVCS